VDYIQVIIAIVCMHAIAEKYFFIATTVGIELEYYVFSRSIITNISI
jgi:hypothetical protein